MPKEFKYIEKLTLDENISKISNFFATQKPIYFTNHIKEKNIIEDSEFKIINTEKTDDTKNNFILPETYLIQENSFHSNREFYEYIKLVNIFGFCEFGHKYWKGSNKQIAYSFKFQDKDIKNKIDIIYYDIYNYFFHKLVCKPIIKISDSKWIFQLNSYYNYWIFFTNLIDEIDKIFEVELIIDCGNLETILELEKQKNYLIYKEIRDENNYKINYENTIIMFEPDFPENYIVKTFKDRYIENIFKPNNYKNKLLIFLAKPLFNLLIFDYKLKQIDTLIDLINPIIPFERLYCLRPYIYEIKELDNNKLILIF